MINGEIWFKSSENLQAIESLVFKSSVTGFVFYLRQYYPYNAKFP